MAFMYTRGTTFKWFHLMILCESYVPSSRYILLNLNIHIFKKKMKKKTYISAAVGRDAKIGPPKKKNETKNSFSSRVRL